MFNFRTSKNKPAKSRSQKIFIADEDPLLCELMRYNLESEGYHVSIFHDADSALDADFTQYDLFIIDLTLDEMSGIKVAQYLKQNRITSSVPLIFCTSRDNEEDVIKGLDYGADDYILKPFSMKELLGRIALLLHINDDEEDD